MKTIDFLPERYRQATKRRRTSYWRLGVTVLFLVAFAAAAGGLFLIERDVRGRYEQTNALHAAAQAQQMLVANKQLELTELRNRAELATFLRHPWPRSRIVHEALVNLPQEVTIERLHLHVAERPKVRVAEAAAAVESTTPKIANAESDLTALRTALEAVDLLVTLEGITFDQPALHVYLQALAASKLFVKAELTSIEAVTGDSSGGEVRFAVRIVVRPGWGMPGGPSAEEAQPADEEKPADPVAEKESASKAWVADTALLQRPNIDAGGRVIP
ncbi:MAG: PilN domain-containing protein [Planctomycetia bacterium]|nr:PilN domain-containing protein [Planctomycetia bacterium]